MYVERTKRTGGFITSLGVSVFWFVYVDDCCNHLFHKIQSNPIIHQHYSTVEVIEPLKKVIVEEEICTRIDGCRIIDNVCIDCLTVKN